MQLALKPYVTTGVAIVGASVIAVAPIVPTPTEIQIPNPAVQVDHAVQLTANEIENAVNQIIFAGTSLGVRLATLPAPLIAPLLGVSPEVATELLAAGALGLGGPLISGPGAIGHAVQDIVNQLGSFNLAELINTLIGAPATIIDGFVNGNFGPNVDSLFLDLGFPFFAGGLINPGDFGIPGASTLPGFFPALQELVSTLLDRLGLGGSSIATLAALAPESDGAIEGAVNFLLFNLVASPIFNVTKLVGSLLAPLIGEQEAALLPIAALGLFGPLISGPGAIGTALQDVVDSLGTGNLAGVINELIGAPATVIDGFINGGYGPSLTPLVGSLLSQLPLPVQGVAEAVQVIPKILAGGLINGLSLFPKFVLPGTIPTLQQLVGKILGFLPGLPAAPALAKTTSVEEKSITDTDTSNLRTFTLNVDSNSGDNSDDNSGGTKTDPPAAGSGNAGATGGSGNVNPGAGEQNKVDENKGDDKTGKPGDKGGQPTDNGKLDTTDGAKFEPGKKGTDTEDNKKDGSTPVDTTVTPAANEGATANTTPGPDGSEGGEQ